MSTSTRSTSAFFTALPGFFFLLMFLLTGWSSRDYWRGTYLIVLVALVIGSLLIGFTLPTVFETLRLRKPWIWILASGLLAWVLAWIILGFLNITPLCIGQDNGDGNNDFGMCVFMTALSGIVYIPLYSGILAVGAVAGHWMLSFQIKTN